MMQPIRIFISYAHEDQASLKQLKKHLALLRQQKLISTWDNRDISAGNEWAHEVDTHINEAEVILLLISAAFLASDYCYSVEMAKALERQEQGSARVIPIILHHVDWKSAPFHSLQALPTDARPVTSRKWQNQNEAFADIAQGIRTVIEELHVHGSCVQPPKRNEQQTKPGGVWIKPKDGEKVKDILRFAAYAYPTHPSDPMISYVNFTIGWNGYWQIACVAHQAASGTLYSGEVDLRQLDLPPGELRVSFDVYDRLNNVNLAPQGKRTIRWIALSERSLFDMPQWLRRIRSR